MMDQNLDKNPYGEISLEPMGEFIAGTYASFTLTYTAGIYGMDDLGGLKIFFRFACDQSPLQMENPKAVGYTTATASNGANISIIYHLREGERPWYKMLRLRIEGKGLKKGDTIKIILGDIKEGSPGIRLQTFCEPSFEFRTAVDVFSTNVFIPLASPQIALVSGPPVIWKAFLPSLLKKKVKFNLLMRAEDKWGNPSNKADDILYFRPSYPIKGLPDSYKVIKGIQSHKITGLQLQQFDDKIENFKDSIIYIDLFDSDSNFLTRTNPMIIKSEPSFRHFWGDIHGQSEETIGTNTAEMYFEFARDVAFLDVTGHQGNDFQITKELWRLFNELSEKYYKEHEFVTLFGYEYSANTSLGGDRNVYFLKPYHQIHRSSHALITQDDDQETDCLTAADLFSALLMDNHDSEESVIVIAHVGGRYADILNYHNGRIEHSVEIYSEWGTFEWLLFDAFDKGYRIGIVANSDDHKGRPGVGYPGASKFGTYGGFTCFLSPSLTRESIFYALKHRHHYATTGERIYLEVKGKLNHECKRYDQDPAVFNKERIKIETCQNPIMGDIIEIPENLKINLALSVTVASASPIERIEIFNGRELFMIIRPYLFSLEEVKESPLNLNLDNTKINPNLLKTLPIENFSRFRVKWEGAEFRARKRNASWIGTAVFDQNQILSAHEFNFWNKDAPLQQISDNKLSWNTITSGNIQGFDVDLLDPLKGKLIFHSSQINFELPINKIIIEDTVFDVGGVGKKVSINRCSKNNPHTSFAFQTDIPLKPTPVKDDIFYVKVTLENGHQAWSSPMYFIKQ